MSYIRMTREASCKTRYRTRGTKKVWNTLRKTERKRR